MDDDGHGYYVKKDNSIEINNELDFYYDDIEKFKRCWKNDRF